MLKNKRILLILISVAILFLIPSICNAATINATQTTTTSTGKTVKWSYELNGNSIVNLLCTNTSEVSGTLEIPSTIDGHTVVTIGNTANNYTHYQGAFESCSGLTGVTIPNTVTIIGSEAFKGCVGLKSIAIPDSVTKIDDYAFYGDSGITSVTIGKNASNIGNYTFENCTGLKSITIPNSVTTIGNSAFKGCTGLKTITIPDNVTSLGQEAFRNCSGMTTLTLSKNLTKINRETFSGCKGLTSVVIPDSVTTIAGYDGNIYGAFEYCTNLTKVLIPDAVATIEKSAFYKCEKLTIYGNDGQVSKQYAEDNKIKFDYIKNWDKGTSGNDIAAPKVTGMNIKYSSVMDYYNTSSNRFEIPKGATIQINVTFNEDIVGKTAPTLKIKCGTGNDISITNGVVSGKSCVYNYKIQEGDVGLITVVDLTGGDITDAAGNKAELSCPKLVVEYHSDNMAYANSATGIVEKPDNGDNQGNNNQGTTNKDEKPSSGTQTDKKEDNTQKDTTTKKDSKLPQTGVTLLSLVAISLIVVAVISKVKSNQYKDI